jgi:hypothetical protein
VSLAAGLDKPMAARSELSLARVTISWNWVRMSLSNAAKAALLIRGKPFFLIARVSRALAIFYMPQRE